MRGWWRFLCLLVAWLSPAAVTLDLASCNDGSTGCCMVCPECACGNSCISCATKCTLPKGCACTSSTALGRGDLQRVGEPLMSLPDDAGRDADTPPPAMRPGAQNGNDVTK